MKGKVKMADNIGILTVTGRKKLCRAHAGDTPLSPITKMAWGDGGIDENGEPIEPTGNETGFYHELLSKDIGSHNYMDEEQTICRYTATLEDTELENKMISEIGLYDSDGDLVVYRTFLPKGKDSDVSQTYHLEEIFVKG